jgi:hypothetical protein
MDWPRRRLADLTSQELQQRAVEYRRMAIAARGQSAASALDRLAIRFALLAAKREIQEADGRSDCTDEGCGQNRSEMAKLIASVRQAAMNEPNPVKTLVQFIRTVAAGNADPYIVMGVLLEGAAHVLATSIPRERQEDTAGALLQLLAERLRANGPLE